MSKLDTLVKSYGAALDDFGWATIAAQKKEFSLNDLCQKSELLVSDYPERGLPYLLHGCAIYQQGDYASAKKVFEQFISKINKLEFTMSDMRLEWLLNFVMTGLLADAAMKDVLHHCLWVAEKGDHSDGAKVTMTEYRRVILSAAWVLKADCNYCTNNYQGAIDDCRKALDLFPESTQAAERYLRLWRKQVFDSGLEQDYLSFLEAFNKYTAIDHTLFHNYAWTAVGAAIFVDDKQRAADLCGSWLQGWSRQMQGAIAKKFSQWIRSDIQICMSNADFAREIKALERSLNIDFTSFYEKELLTIG